MSKRPNRKQGAPALEPDSPSLDEEDSIIAALLATVSEGRPNAARAKVGPGDDAAVWDDRTVVTVDTLIEGVHFNDRLGPGDVGFKALAVSVSDVLAMGAVPTWAVLSLSLPRMMPDWLSAFAQGLSEALQRFGVELIGGDTTSSSGPIVVSMTVGGSLATAPWKRSSARMGDDIWVTGTLGLAGMGWSHPDPPEPALQALRRPSPPLAFVRALRSSDLSPAAMDLSDGLARDAQRMATASGVGMRLKTRHLPGHACLGQRALVYQTRGGEDYQLLFCLSPKHREAVQTLARTTDTRLTRIGRVQEGGLAFLNDGPWPPALFAHFPSNAGAGGDKGGDVPEDGGALR